mmetsp:Transcript_15648/g.34163  ORF Transcript_15648/g.34163 Transcript_15648/m.34163 type:complete len:85 (-) Transcript_15648:841-1095(-)
MAASCGVLVQGDSMGSLVVRHTAIPSEIVGCGIETWFWENGARIWLTLEWVCGVLTTWNPDLVRDLLAISVSVTFATIIGVNSS